MSKYRALIALLISTALGLVVVGILSQWMKRQMSVEMVDVMVAARDIPMGTRLQPTMLKTVRWPRSAIFKDPLSSLEESQDRVVNITVLQDEPILKSKLAPAGERGGLSAQLKDGKRAVTVKVNEVVGVAGFALPGNYVDVMVNTPDSQNNLVSKIVLERIQVLAVAQDNSAQENKPKVVNAVTLEVTPSQAEEIDLARSIGTLSLVLRNHIDQGSVVTQGARKSDLLRPSVRDPHRDARVGQTASVVGHKATTTSLKGPLPDRTTASALPPASTLVIRGLTASLE